jgi:hypothetical protein
MDIPLRQPIVRAGAMDFRRLRHAVSNEEVCYSVIITAYLRPIAPDGSTCCEFRQSLSNGKIRT